MSGTAERPMCRHPMVGAIGIAMSDERGCIMSMGMATGVVQRVILEGSTITDTFWIDLNALSAGIVVQRWGQVDRIFSDVPRKRIIGNLQ